MRYPVRNISIQRSISQMDRITQRVNSARHRINSHARDRVHRHFSALRVILSRACTCRKFNFPRLIQIQIQVAAVDTVMHDDPSDEWKKREKEKERFMPPALVVYSSGVHISRRLRATTRLFTQQTYRSAALNPFQPCASRGCIVTPGVCIVVAVFSALTLSTTNSRRR